MVVNQNHVQSLLAQVSDDATPASLREDAATYEDYVSRGKTLKDAGTSENVSIDSLAEVARVLRAGADAIERGEVATMQEAWEQGIGPAPTHTGTVPGRGHEPSISV